MRAWWIPALVLLAACNDDNGNGPGDHPRGAGEPLQHHARRRDCAGVVGQSVPGGSRHLRELSGLQHLLRHRRGRLRLGLVGRGHHRGARVLVCSARQRGAALLFGDRRERGWIGERPVAAGGETPRVPTRATWRCPRRPTTPNGSGFRFWHDLNDDGATQSGSWDWSEVPRAPDIDFFVDRDGFGDLYLTPVRTGTGVEYYNENDPVEDLTSIDFAEDLEIPHKRDQGRAGFRLRVRDRRWRWLRSLWRGAGPARRDDVPDHGLGISDGSGKSGAAGAGIRGSDLRPCHPDEVRDSRTDSIPARKIPHSLG